MKVKKFEQLRNLKSLRFRTLCGIALCAIMYVTVGNAADSDQTTAASENSEAPEVLNTVYPEWFKTSFMELEEDILEAQEAGKRLMLVFHQPGCPYCDAFVQQNLSQKNIEETVKTNFDVIEINMWGDLEVTDVDGEEFTEKTFAEYLEVQFTPTILMYHPDGSIAMRINGYFPPEKFSAALNYVMNENTDDISFNKYLTTANPQALDANANNASTPVAYDYLKNDDFHSEESIVLPASDNNTPYVVLFEQQNCPNCIEFHDTVLSREPTLSMLGDFGVFRIDMWGKDKVKLASGKEVTSRELASQLGINYAPTMVFYSADHEEVIRSESWIKQFHTQSMLEYVKTAAWREQPSFQRFIRARADEIREAGGVVRIIE